MMRDCPEKKSMIDLGGGNSLVDLSNYLKVSSGRVWWKKIAEKRKEKCKLHFMVRARNMKKTKSFMHLFMNRFQPHICQCDTKSKSRETCTNKSTGKKHKDTTNLRKGTTDDINTNKFTG